MTRGLLADAKPILECGFKTYAANNAVIDFARRTGKFPPAATWQDAIIADFQKVRDEMLAQRPDDIRDLGLTLPEPGEPLVCTWEAESSSIAFNSDLSEKPFSEVKPDTIVVFEVKSSGKNLTEKYKERSRLDAPRLRGETRDWLELKIDSPRNPWERGPGPGVRTSR